MIWYQILQLKHGSTLDGFMNPASNCEIVLITVSCAKKCSFRLIVLKDNRIHRDPQEDHFIWLCFSRACSKQWFLIFSLTFVVQKEAYITADQWQVRLLSSYADSTEVWTIFMTLPPSFPNKPFQCWLANKVSIKNYI